MAKKLTKNLKDKKISGICSGVAKYFELDPTLVRLIWILIVFFTGIVPGVIIYIIAAFIMPEK